jgi:hypothetical protein
MDKHLCIAVLTGDDGLSSFVLLKKFPCEYTFSCFHFWPREMIYIHFATNTTQSILSNKEKVLSMQNIYFEVIPSVLGMDDFYDTYSVCVHSAQRLRQLTCLLIESKVLPSQSCFTTVEDSLTIGCYVDLASGWWHCLGVGRFGDPYWSPGIYWQEPLDVQSDPKFS